MRALEMERGGESEIKQDKRKCRAPQTREGYFISEGTTEEKAERARNAKERVTECVDERRGGQRGESTQGSRGLDVEGVKSGDLQVQLEQPVTLMVH